MDDRIGSIFRDGDARAPTPRFEQFDPWSIHRQWVATQGDVARRLIDVVNAYDSPTLLDRNSYYFDQNFDDAMTARMLWSINTELTRRGVAPAWRRIPLYAAPGGRLPKVAPAAGTPRKLSSAVKRNLMRRWVDLEWLRFELGPSHETSFRIWRNAFSDDANQAAAVFAKVNRVQSHGGGRYAPLQPYQVLRSLAIPPLHKIALTGLIDRDGAERSANVRRRVQERYRPQFEAMMERDRRPLEADEVSRRLLYCEAIELAKGGLTDAATVLRWMTGKAVTRQTVGVMKERIARQCGLRTAYWRPVKSARAK